MNNAEVVQVGGVFIWRIWCNRCKEYSFVTNGMLQCCGAGVEKPKKYKFRREFEAEKKRTHLSSYKRKAVLERANYKCEICGVDLKHGKTERHGIIKDIKIHIDHFMPWVVYGDNSVDNLHANCSMCNLIKSSKVFDTYEDLIKHVMEIRQKKGIINL